MEVWEMEAYCADHTLKEILTIKSDDVPERYKAYESIIKGEPIQKLNIPESFNVLLRELNGLGLKIELINSKSRSSFSSIGNHEVGEEPKVDDKEEHGEAKKSEIRNQK